MSAQEAGCPALPPLHEIPALPLDETGVVFAAPWEAKAFALVVELHQRGCFSWSEWAATLSREIAADSARAGATPYYELWLAAAEKLLGEKGVVEADVLSSVQDELRHAQAHAAHDHPHGEHHHH